jgi:hypothetical protein
MIRVMSPHFVQGDNLALSYVLPPYCPTALPPYRLLVLSHSIRWAVLSQH